MKKVFFKQWQWGIAVIAAIALVSLNQEIPAMEKNRDFLAALFFPASISLKELQSDYRNQDLHILIVPGHDNEAWGTEYKNIFEADLTLGVARYLVALLRADSAFRVTTTRETGTYTPAILDYFKNQETAIKQFKKEKEILMEAATQIGFEERSTVMHNNASRDVAFKLYGINKWANDHGVGIVLHLHFNDYGGRRQNQVGRYSGFVVYVPDRQLPNAQASRAIAQPIFNQLDSVLAVSDLPQESAGIVEDQELIALGVNTSLNAASLLIEYGYIYELPFRDETIREVFFQELAYQTYLGLKKALDPNFHVSPGRESLLLPHQWNRKLSAGIKGDKDVLALQVALMREGVYPPAGKDCPVSSNFLECTEISVKAFQNKYDLFENGIVDGATIKKLNELYGTSAL